MNKYMRILIILLCVLVVSGCNNKKNTTDAERFKEEYSMLDIDENNIIEYSSINNVLKMLDKDSGVVYIGNSNDDLSKKILPILLNASDNTDLDKIYYVDSSKIRKKFNIKDKDNKVIISDTELEIPLVLFIANGDVIDYHIGTIDNKLDLNKDEIISLYFEYLDGIHKVLNDQCDTDSKGDEHC